MSLNADKIAELELKACLEEYHLIFITETWFNETSVPSLKNYDLFRRDRGSNGGGVCIYVRKDLDSIEIADENLEKVLNGKNSEQLWRCVSLNNQLILIGCIYRPPPSSDHTKNQKVAEEIIKSLLIECFLTSLPILDFSVQDLKFLSLFLYLRFRE